jgi:SET domain-containing protein
MYKPLPKCLTIKESGIHGFGLFAAEDISSGTVLGISHVVDNRFEDDHIRTPLGGFYNHSEEPNCGTYQLGDFVYLKAIKDIKTGEEIVCHYTLYMPL